MFLLIRIIFKFVFLGLLFFTLFQIKIGDKKLYFHTEDFIYNLIKQKDFSGKNLFDLSTQKVKFFVKNKISALFEKEKIIPTKNKIDSLINNESDMDEIALKKILGH